MKKKLIFSSVGITVIILAIFFLYQYDNEEKVVLMDKHVPRKKGTSAISMMYETEAGSGIYEATTDSSFSPAGYNFNAVLSKCENGSALEYDSATGKVMMYANTSDRCYLYFDKIIDIKVMVSTDGTSGSIPTGNTYTQTLSCNNATAEYSNRYRRIEVSALAPESSCNLTYTQDTSTKTTLASIVQANATTITSTNNAGGTDTSYRYTGKNPDNYVWFNNEMWRIIGLIPTCTASGCSSEENLVKIIRNESIGGLAYDASSTDSSSLIGAWGSNTLYKLLNEYYYGKSDGTSSGYCYGYYSSSYQPIAGCDYTSIGISSSSTDYYGRMVKNIYWNTGASAYNATASAVYTTETATQTVQGRIGLMAASDFGYAASTSYHSKSMYSYSSAVATDWLYGLGYEWTSIQYSSYSYRALYVYDTGYLLYSNAYNGSAARPVLYLDSSVYKITGEGTYNNPYIIGM